MPGLIADRYGDTVVVKLYTPGWLAHWTEVEQALREELKPRILMLRLSRNLAEAAERRWGIVEGFRGAAGEDTVIFEETGLRFEAPIRFGQKTGFFLDQREKSPSRGGPGGGAGFPECL